MISYEQDPRFLAWAAERIGIKRFREDAKTIARLDGGDNLLAVVIYDTFSQSFCHMHVASDGGKRWLTRELLVRAFAYPFVQCELRRVFAMVPASNEAALRFNRHLGFVDEGFHPFALPNDHLRSLGMSRGSCRYLPRGLRNA